MQVCIFIFFLNIFYIFKQQFGIEEGWRNWSEKNISVAKKSIQIEYSLAFYL